MRPLISRLALPATLASLILSLSTPALAEHDGPGGHGPGPGGCPGMQGGGHGMMGKGMKGDGPSPFQDLIDKSKAEGKGLTFYVNGQAIPGVVTEVIDPQTVALRNQTHDRIILRLNKVDAVAAN